MKAKFTIAVIAVAATLAQQAGAQIYDTNGVVVQTFAGSGFTGYLDGVGQQTMFNYPNAVVADSHGNLLVWDARNARIRLIAPDATVTTFAGGGNQSSGVGTNVNLAPLNIDGGTTAMTIDRNDTIWVVNGISTFFNGRSGVFGSPLLCKITSGANVTITNLFQVVILGYYHAFAGICPDSLGNIYISDAIANVIYRYATNGVLSVFAGSGNPGYADGNGIFTAFMNPAALVADAANNIYVWDSGNYLIRRIDQSRNVTTFAGEPGFYGQQPKQTDGVGTNAIINSISQMCFDASGSLLFVGGDRFFYSGLCVREITPATNVITMAGSFTNSGYANGAGNLARFNRASGICVSGGTIYVADSSNQRVRSITNNPTAQPVLPANLQLDTYPGLRIIGTVGRTYRIESSPDTTNWTTSTTLLLTSSPYLWFDQNPVSGNKFYRAMLLP